MTYPLDIHTHAIPAVAGTAIVNVFPQDFDPAAAGWFSTGFHPYHVAEATPAWWSAWEAQTRLPQVLAVGEAGLDKACATDFEMQLDCFRRQALWAEEVGKPLVVHLVRAADELLQVRSEVRPRMPWVIHGFRKGGVLARQLADKGMYLSFGPRFRPDALRAVPLDRLFLETDESGCDIHDVLAAAAEALDIETDALRNQLMENIKKVFFGL